MHGARLADESSAKFLEDRIERDQNSPEAIGVDGIVTRVRHVMIEANRIWNFDRHGPDFHVYFQRREHFHELAVEPRYGPVIERNRPRFAAARLDIEPVVD